MNSKCFVVEITKRFLIFFFEIIKFYNDLFFLFSYFLLCERKKMAGKVID